MGMFSGMGSATRGYQSNVLKEGEYLVRIDSCEHFEAKNKGEGFKTTLTILNVLSGTNHRPGEVVNTVWLKKGEVQMWLGNIKGFIAGCLGVEDARVDETVATEVAGPNNPLKGQVTKVKAITRVSKKKDEKTGEFFNYTLYSWSAVLTPDELRAALPAEDLQRFFPSGI